MDRGPHPGEGLLQGGPPAGERLSHPVDLAQGEQVEGDQPGRVWAASRATRLAAGWMRNNRASKSSRRPSASGTTISASTTQQGGRLTFMAWTTSGLEAQGPSGSSGTGLASIGATGGITGRSMPSSIWHVAPVWWRAWPISVAYRPGT